jgi:uncharacterized membrane protein YgcG
VTHRTPSGRARPPQPDIQLRVDLDRELRPHRSAKIEAHLRVDVAPTGTTAELHAVELAVIVAVDLDESRRTAARHALPAALRALPDGISFTVLGGGGPAPVPCYPRSGAEWAVADQDEKRRAAFAAGAVPLHRDGPRPAGYGVWAARARALLAGRPVSVRHLLLITDGSSAPGGTPRRLEEELDACAGHFTCDVFAMGADWAPDPLLTIAERLHGRAEFVDDGLGRAITAAVQRLRRVQMPQLPVEVTVRPSVRQVALSEKAPRPHRLGGLRTPGRPHHWSFPTYQWEPGRRDYLLTLVADADADHDPLDTELQFAMVSVGDAHAAVTARWQGPGPAHPPQRTDGAGFRGVPGDRSGSDGSGGHEGFGGSGGSGGSGVFGGSGGDSVRELNATTRMRNALRRGLAALQEHRRETAEDCLGQAARLAARFGEDWVLDEIRVVAAIDDASAGRLRLRDAAVDAVLDTGALGPMILRAGSGPGTAPDGAGVPRRGPRCARCGAPAGSEARYCVVCGEKLL